MRLHRSVGGAVAIIFSFCLLVFVLHLNPPTYTVKERGEENALNQSARLQLLRLKCQQFKNPMRSEYSAFYTDEPKKLGVEVVYLQAKKSNDKPLISVCLPHKVGSHAWGQFANLPELKVAQGQLDLSWNIKAALSLRAVIVRHPLERLLSVYRMIFEDWCDQERFLAHQWDNVCVTDIETDSTDFRLKDAAVNGSKFSAIHFLYSMADEQRHGNDRYIQKIWQHFHPGEKLVDPKRQLKFTFSQFVRFLVNGSLEFDSDIINYKGLSYHWAPYWQECSLCSSITQPQFILHMESFEQDLHQLLAEAGYSLTSTSAASPIQELIEKFPHTHSQSGGHSHKLASIYYSQLTKAEVQALHDMYRIDHEMFGYNPSVYLSYASE